ncbi:MAG TPA: hypothetical protein VNI57_15510, partial [Candidatus Saccharimonadales bacterium]|nr:hypothetical protein [Candidatus Saccharimonadales bacterium]
PVAPQRAPEPEPPPPLPADPAEAAPSPSGEPAAGEDTDIGEPIPEEEIEEELRGTYQKILSLNVNEKITLAARGDREERLILIRDANRSVQEAVINSPKITENEVESIAKMRNVKDVVLRRISNRRDWMKRYAIVRGLATNPKTPLPISMPLLKRLNLQDLKMMITDRNLPEMLRRLAKKALDQRLNRGR